MRVRLILVALALFACKRISAPSAAPVVVQIVYGSEKKSWLEEQIAAFQSKSPKTASGRPIRIAASAMGSGEAVQQILSGSLKPAVFSPASGAYLTLLNQGWLSAPGHTQPLAPAGDPLVLSPVVLALWRPMAEALGWPARQPGWSDLLKVNADARGWGAVGHPEWGRFKLGHTHPAFSTSGLLAVLAEAYAGAHKSRRLTAEDLAAKETRAFVTAVESSIVHYGKSTGFFAEKMLARGPEYLSAAVLYENLVIESYGKPHDGPAVVCVYPAEGTFWADHPYAMLEAEWVDAEQRQGAAAFLAFLKARPAQERALALGFRPADPAVPVGAPIDAAHGADPKQPQNLLEVPPGPVLAALLDAWRATKRGADVALVFDKSGSMNGRPMDQARAGAQAFLRSLQDRDQVLLQFFDHAIYPPFGPGALGGLRESLEYGLRSVQAGGGTALYDATSSAFNAARERARADPSRIHAVVVMTDGRDENSKMSLTDLRRELMQRGPDVKVFTIAYGDGADIGILGQIADAAQGTAVKGSAESIVQVYEDMASFF
jgi:Ca-activated chloride channel family protein